MHPAVLSNSKEVDERKRNKISERLIWEGRDDEVNETAVRTEGKVKGPRVWSGGPEVVVELLDRYLGCVSMRE